MGKDRGAIGNNGVKRGEKRVEKWIFKDSHFLTNTSTKDSKFTILLRYKASKIIERIGNELKMPCFQINIGKILLHRFYMRKSFKIYEYHEIAATILFIAGKLGAGGNFVAIDKIIHHIVRDCCKDPVKRAALDTSEGSKDYQYWSTAIFHYEDVVLETLCFDDHAQIPHTIALALIQEFNGSKLFQHTAHLYCNDALNTTLAVRYSAPSIAYAAVYAAQEACGQVLVNANETQWWVTKGLNLTHLKGTLPCHALISALAREITVSSDPHALASLFDKVMTRASEVVMPPHTPVFESSPLSNAETACNVSTGVVKPVGHEKDAVRQTVTSFF